jgi:hypothetical protein
MRAYGAAVDWPEHPYGAAVDWPEHPLGEPGGRANRQAGKRNRRRRLVHRKGSLERKSSACLGGGGSDRNLAARLPKQQGNQGLRHACNTCYTIRHHSGRSARGFCKTSERRHYLKEVVVLDSVRCNGPVLCARMSLELSCQNVPGYLRSGKTRMMRHPKRVSTAYTANG